MNPDREQVAALGTAEPTEAPVLLADDAVVVLRLASVFLSDYADRLGNDGCNDWSWPEWVPADARVRLLTAMALDDTYRDGPPNDVLAAFLSTALNVVADAGQTEPG